MKAVCKEKPFIKYVGRVSDSEKLRLLKESSLLVLPSSAEGFGLVLIESLSCGTPFVAYDIPAVREVSNLTRGGVLVSHRDWNALARQIVSLLRDVPRASGLAKDGRRYVEDNFTWELVAMRQQEVLQRLSRRTSGERSRS